MLEQCVLSHTNYKLITDVNKFNNSHNKSQLSQ